MEHEILSCMNEMFAKLALGDAAAAAMTVTAPFCLRARGKWKSSRKTGSFPRFIGSSCFAQSSKKMHDTAHRDAITETLERLILLLGPLSHHQR